MSSPLDSPIQKLGAAVLHLVEVQLPAFEAVLFLWPKLGEDAEGDCFTSVDKRELAKILRDALEQLEQPKPTRRGRIARTVRRPRGGQ